MDKRLQKVAVASVVPLFSTNILSYFNAYQDNSLLFGATVYAAEEEPPADEDIPNGAETSLLKTVAGYLDEIQAAIDEGDLDYARDLRNVDYAYEIGEIKNIKDMKASRDRMLQRIAAIDALLNGGPTDPVVTTRTEPIAITTEYIADPTADANTQVEEFAGVAGTKTYTTTNGVEDAGVVTTAMQPRRVKVGTKTVVVTEAIPAPADIEEQDATLPVGQRLLKTAAVAGSKTTTTTYTLDPVSGKAIANTPTVDSKEGTAAVYRVGTKPVDVSPKDQQTPAPKDQQAPASEGGNQVKQVSESKTVLQSTGEKTSILGALGVLLLAAISSVLVHTRKKE